MPSCPPDTVDPMTDHFAGDPRTNRERMLAGDLYIADDPESSRIAERGARLADAYHRAFLNDPDSASPLLAELLGELGEDAVIKPPLYVDYGENIHFGARSFANYNLTALDVAEIRIGTDCQIGPNVQLLTPTTRTCVGNAWRLPNPSRSAIMSGSAEARSSAPVSPSVRTASSEPERSSPRTSRPDPSPSAIRRASSDRSMTGKANDHERHPGSPGQLVRS